MAFSEYMNFITNELLNLLPMVLVSVEVSKKNERAFQKQTQCLNHLAGCQSTKIRTELSQHIVFLPYLGSLK